MHQPLMTPVGKRPAARWLLLAALVCAFAMVFGLAFGPAGEALAEQVQRQLWTNASKGRSKVAVKMPSLSKLADHLSPSVVSITVVQQSPTGPADPMNEFFRRFFGGVPESFRGRGIGTGFVINKSGHILTNSHVVEKAQQIHVQLHDGTEVPAKVVGIDPPTDLALLQIPAKGQKLQVAVLGNSDTLEIGDWVMAIGNPFGLDYTVTAGIVSAKERRQVDPDGRGGYHNYIQTDASINPGNSGGPLFNLNGHVVGVNAAINAAGQGIGFAIPINMAKTLLPQLATQGYVRRSWLGVMTQPLSLNLARSFGLKGRPRGALVSAVVPGGPASKAGIKSGDIVLRFDGKNIGRSEELPWLASSSGVGRKVPIVLFRGGREVTVKASLVAMPGQGGPPLTKAKAKASPRPTALGVAVQPAPASVTGGAKAVIVSSISPTGYAAQAGLQRGDLVVDINGSTVDSVPTFHRLSGAFQSGQVVRFRILRGRRPVFLALEVP